MLLLLNAENKQIALAVILTKSRWERGEEVHQGQLQGQQWWDGGHGHALVGATVTIVHLFMTFCSNVKCGFSEM